MSLRLRSILAAALATLIAVAVLGSAVDVLVAGHLRRELDHTLRARAVSVAQLAASAPALLATPGSLDSAVGAAQALVEVVDRHDRLVARSLSLGGRVLPVSIARSVVATGVGRYRTVRLGSDEVRVYAAPLADVSGPAAGGAVLVAAATSDVADTIHTLHVFTLLAALVAAAAGALAVAVLMRGALSPLARLDRAAAEIGRTGDPTQRLPDPARADEVGRLASTLNAMLDSLERSRDAERRFVADASHELRTPLTALRGNVEHLARHGATPELVTDLQLDAERLARLADDLLALSREDAGTAAGRTRTPGRGGTRTPGRTSPRSCLRSRCEVTAPRSSGRSRTCSRTPAGTARRADGHRDGGRGRRACAPDVSRTRAPAWRWTRPSGRSSGSGDAARRVARGWASRSCARRPSGTAGVRTPAGSSFTIELPVCQESVRESGYTCGEDLEKGTP